MPRVTPSFSLGTWPVGLLVCWEATSDSARTFKPKPWIAFRSTVVPTFQYPVTCKIHKCPKLGDAIPVAIMLHVPEASQPEILDGVEILQEMPEGNPALVKVEHQGVAVQPRVYLCPNEPPGIHLQKLPRLATIQGTIISMDAGTLGATEKKKARGPTELADEDPGMTAAGASRHVTSFPRSF